MDVNIIGRGEGALAEQLSPHPSILKISFNLILYNFCGGTVKTVPGLSR